MRLRKNRLPDVVASVTSQADEAAALARIVGQERLADPRTDPAVRPYFDRLRVARLKRRLSSEDVRDRRRHRVDDRIAEHAEQALDALHQARETTSPAKRVRALYKSRARYMHIALGTSVVLAFGSARGLEHLAAGYDSVPAGSGYIAEIGLTGLTTIVILARSELSQNDGKLTGFQNVVLWTLMVVPLIASMVANIIGRNLIGAVCAAGAAAFALFSYVIADAFASSARAQAEKVTDVKEADLRRIAVGDDLFAARTGEVREPEVQEEPAPVQVQVRAEVQESVPVEVHEPDQVQVHKPLPVNPNPAAPVEPEPANQGPEVREPREPELMNPEVHAPKVQEPTKQAAPRTTRTTPSLGDRAQRKANEVQQVRELIHELGRDAVTLNLVRERFGFTKTTAYNRLTEARNIVDQAVAS